MPSLQAAPLRVVAWQLRPYRAAFARPLATAHGPWVERTGCYVLAVDALGRYGRGEAAPLGAWGTEDMATAIAALASLPPLEVTQLQDILPALAAAGLDLQRTPAAHAAAEGALLELLARAAELPLAALLGRAATSTQPRPAPRVVVSALVTAQDPAAAAAEARQLVAAGFTTLKLKLGAEPNNLGNPALDESRLAAVCAVSDATIALRLDANAAWSAAQALERLAGLAQALSPQRAVLVEQPTPAADFAALAHVIAHSPLPIAADETAHLPGGLAAALAAGVAALVLKPAALGGLLATQAAIQAARARHCGVILTSALDRGVSTAGVLHLAAATPGLLPAGLATAGLFADGPALAGLDPVRGAIALPITPGLGYPSLDPLLELT